MARRVGLSRNGQHESHENDLECLVRKIREQNCRISEKGLLDAGILQPFSFLVSSAIYYINTNGGLTAADLLNDLADDPEVSKLPNSENFKDEFLPKLL